MYHRILFTIISLFVLISCNSTTAKIDQHCMTQYSSSFIEPENSLYNLPYGIGESYELRQGNCTFHTHSVENQTQFAFDFIMDIGTPIHAARSGQVAAIEDRYFDGNSGDTGMESIPHLHFHVIEPNDECFQNSTIGICPTIPISFKNSSPHDKILNQGIFYTAI